MTLNEIIEKIKLALDPYIFLELLDLEFEELVDALEDVVVENMEVFEDYFAEESDD